VKKKYLVLLLIPLVIALSGCGGGKKKLVAPPPAPSAPSNLSANAISSTEVNLNWQDNSTNEKGFYLYRRGTGNYAKVAILGANATSYDDDGLMPETSYWYKVIAYNDGGESASSNEVNVRTPSGPEPEPELQAPTNLTATAVSYKQINLSWKDNSTNEDGYKVKVRHNGGVYDTIAELGPNATRYEHSKLQPMTEYEYYVVVYRGEDWVNSEGGASAITPCPVVILSSGTSARDGVEYLDIELKNNASEDCEVEVTVNFYDAAGLLETKKADIYMKPISYEWLEIVISPYFGWKTYTIEITDVEIDY